MVSSGARQNLRSTAESLLLAAIAATCTALSLESAANDEPQQPILEKIRAIQSQDGPASPDLIDPLTGLGLLYQESGDHDLAIAAIDRAVQIVRINDGLRSLDQAPLIRLLIHNEEERGREAAVWDLEQKLLTLLRRYPEDLRTVPYLHEVADKQMRVLKRFLAGETPPQAILGCFYKPFPLGDGNCHSGSRKDVVQGMLAEAQRTYADAIAVILRNELYSSRDLRDLETALLLSNDLVRSRYHRDGGFLLVPSLTPTIGEFSEPWRSRIAPIVELAGWDLPYLGTRSLENDKLRQRESKYARVATAYNRGRQGLRRLYAYEVASSSPLLDQIHALIQMADWDLLHSEYTLALDGYARAHAMLRAGGIAQSSIDELFLPRTPIVIPTFLPNPLTPDEPQQTNTYIDVAFEITRFGRGRKVEILDTQNATDDTQNRLVRLLRNSRFRPIITDGESARGTPIVVRYYFNEQQDVSSVP